MRSKLLQKIFYNWQVKILCFLVAVFVYFVLVFSIQTKRTVTLPVEVRLPATYTATSNIPNHIDLILQGSEDQIYMVNIKNIGLMVDFTTVDREGVSYATVQIDTKDLDEYMDTSSVSIYTYPSQLKVYFVKNGASK